MIGTTFANVNALGARRHQRHDLGRYQPIVEHHVRLLNQAEGTQGKQVGITGAGTDQVGFANAAELVWLGKRALEQGFGLGVIAGKNRLGDGALQHVLPEIDALAFIGQQLFHPRPATADEIGQFAIPVGQKLAELTLQDSGQDRRTAVVRDRHGNRPAIDNRGKNEVAEIAIVGTVHRNIARARKLRDRGIDLGRVGGRDNTEIISSHLLGRKCALDQLASRFLEQPPELRIDVGRDHVDARPGRQQRRQPPARNPTAANDETTSTFEFEQQRIKLHRHYRTMNSNRAIAITHAAIERFTS